MNLRIQTNADMAHDELVKNRFARVFKWSIGLLIMCAAVAMVVDYNFWPSSRLAVIVTLDVFLAYAAIEFIFVWRISMTIRVPWWMKLIDGVLRSGWAAAHTAEDAARYLANQATVARHPDTIVYIQPAKWRRCVGVARMYPLYQKD